MLAFVVSFFFKKERVVVPGKMYVGERERIFNQARSVVKEKKFLDQDGKERSRSIRSCSQDLSWKILNYILYVYIAI